MRNIIIGVDGGATKSTLRVEDEQGNLLGCIQGGPANIRVSVEETWHSIRSALMTLLAPLGISLNNPNAHLHAGMGLAGCEVEVAYQAFIKTAHPFATLVVSSDAHVACLGAHLGQDGAIIVAGTGTVGYQIQNDQHQQVGGWGFPHDDEGGGAWLGLQATKQCLHYLDGRAPSSELVRAICQHFANDRKRLVNWANQANSAAFATLAPIVIQQSLAKDPDAIELLKQAAVFIECIGRALESAQIPTSAPLPCALIGGIAPFLEPFLGASLCARLRPCLESPEVGALLLVRQVLNRKNL